ncbi:MAG: VPLPA-CTERM sorting domain-containing protein [Methylococcaceae bacterium]|nr:VPLPA-CTERM sorting domain-containing protein [Methylococcaceae bacterium]
MKKYVLGLVFFMMSLSSSLSMANSLIVSGNINTTSDVSYYSFNLNTIGPVRIETFQWGGGTLSDGTLVAKDGFASQLTLFDATGNFVAFDDGFGSFDFTGRPRTPGQFDDYDALIDFSVTGETIAAGLYTVAISYFDNYAGNSLADPYQGPLTQGFPLGEGNNFTYQITGDVSSVSAVPVPAAIWFMASGLLGLVGMQKRRVI